MHSSVSNSNEPYDVKVTNPSGLSGTLSDAFNVNARPVWSTSSGTVATISDNATGTHATLAASDPEGDAITYSGTVGGGMSVNSSTGAITGDPTDVSSNTTVSFTLNATSSGSNVTARNFNIIVAHDLNYGIGINNQIYPFASIGNDPQDLKFQGEETKLEIGDYNKIREYVTINPGTKGGGGLTKIGDNCLFMVSAHIAHDCFVGNNSFHNCFHRNFV